MNTTVKACLVALLGGLICSGAMAQPMRVEEVPESLRAWVPWVLHGNTTAGCVRHGDDFLCDWTTELSLTMNERTGSFALTALADNQTDIMLPGTGASFPQHVRVDGRPAVVLTESGVPFVAVTRGTHRIEGDFSWTERPETLAVPRSIGLVRLSLDGRVVESVRRDEAGSVWLARRETEVTEADRTSVEVHRRIADGNPIRVETRIALQIGGRAREIALGSVLLEGSLPVQATSSIPMRLSAEGVLTVQAAAGSHEITIESRMDSIVISCDHDRVHSGQRRAHTQSAGAK